MSSARPRTGVGAFGLGNHRRMLHVRQLGPPPTKMIRPCVASVHSVLYGSSRSMSWPIGPGSLRVSIAHIMWETSGKRLWMHESRDPASSLPA